MKNSAASCGALKAGAKDLTGVGLHATVHIELCCIESNVAHKVQRYIHLFVASELVSDVLGFILIENSCGQYEQQSDSPAANLRFPSPSKLEDIQRRLFVKAMCQL